MFILVGVHTPWVTPVDSGSNRGDIQMFKWKTTSICWLMEVDLNFCKLKTKPQLIMFISSFHHDFHFL